MVAADLAGIPPRLRYVERAAERLGLTGAERAALRVVGGEVDGLKVPDFILPRISDVQWGLPLFLKNRLRHYFTSRPAQGEGCTLCGACVTACPPRAIAILSGRLVFDYHACIRCFCCRELCPNGALKVEEGLLLKYINKYR